MADKLRQKLLTKEYWINAIPLLAAITGIVALLCAYFVSFGNSSWNSLFKISGTTILASGVFSFMVKYGRFAKIFKDELLEIIYGSTYLEQQKNIFEIWERVSKVLFNNKFPGISDHIIADVKNTYFPTTHVLYYNDFAQTLQIELLDKTTEKIKVWQHSRFEIFPVQQNEAFDLKGTNTLLFDNAPSEVSFRIVNFKVNGEMVSTDHNEVLNGQKVVSNYNIPLSGHSSYKVELDIEKEYSLKHDNIIGVMRDYLIHNFNLKILLKGDIGIDFYPVGTLNAFVKDRVSTNTYQEYDYKGIIYPRQGYLLFLKIK